MYKRLHAAAAVDAEVAQPGLIVIYALTFLSASPPKSHQKYRERLNTCDRSLFLHPDGVATKHF